jgi:hypothetical protein
MWTNPGTIGANILWNDGMPVALIAAIVTP